MDIHEENFCIKLSIGSFKAVDGLEHKNEVIA